MYAFATSGSQGNNNRFSTCSRESMRLFIRTRGQEGDNGIYEWGLNGMWQYIRAKCISLLGRPYCLVPSFVKIYANTNIDVEL